MQIETISLFNRENIKVFANRPNTIHSFFKETVKKFKDKPALISEETVFTYEELDQLSDRIATNLQHLCGVVKGDRVGVVVGNSSEFPLIVLACSKLGAIMVPINVKLSADEMDYIIGHSKPKVLIYEEEFKEKISALKKSGSAVLPKEQNIFVIKGSNSFEKILAETDQHYETNVSEEDSAYILYTSGTTGKPKGAVLSHVNVIHSVLSYTRVFKTDHTLKTIIAVPMFHVTGLVGQLLHLFYVGGTVYSMRRYQNEEYIHRIQENKINFLFNVPTIFIMMFTSKEFQKYNFDFVKKVAFGGAAIYKQTFQMLKEAFPNATLHNAYGSTETTSPATLMPTHYPVTKVSSVGLPVEVAEIKVINGEGNECKIGESGELYIRGPMVVKEYWDNPQANLSSFEDGYWKSGDIGFIDEDGYVFIRDRKKDMINRAGEKIFSVEVEDVLKNHPDVVEAAVVGVPDPIFGERVKAFVVGPNLNPRDFSPLKEYCLKYLAKFKVPEEFELIESLPRNAAGKILKNTLKEVGGMKHA